MLVLTRRRGDEIIVTIGDRQVVRIIVLESGKSVKIGFDALPEVRIMRSEVLEK